MPECIFCDIAEGKANAYKVYEDKYSLCFLDTAPISKGHCLIIPRSHFENINDTDENSLKRLMIVSKKVSKLLEDRLGADGINMLHASGKAAQQSVLHFHIHLVPRYESDGLNTWPKSKYKEKSIKSVFEQIKKN